MNSEELIVLSLGKADRRHASLRVIRTSSWSKMINKRDSYIHFWNSNVNADSVN
jgi:hypothetical protein